MWPWQWCNLGVWRVSFWLQPCLSLTTAPGCQAGGVHAEQGLMGQTPQRRQPAQDPAVRGGGSDRFQMEAVTVTTAIPTPGPAGSSERKNTAAFAWLGDSLWHGLLCQTAGAALLTSLHCYRWHNEPLRVAASKQARANLL